MRWIDRIGSAGRPDRVKLQSSLGIEEIGPSRARALRTLSFLMETGAIERASSLARVIERGSWERQSKSSALRSRALVAAIHAFSLQPERSLSTLPPVDSLPDTGLGVAILGTRAFCLALTGETSGAVASYQSAVEMATRAGMESSSALAPAFASQVLIAFESGDAALTRKFAQAVLELELRSDIGKAGAKAMAHLPQILERSTLPAPLANPSIQIETEWGSTGTRFGEYLRWVQTVGFLADGYPGLAITATPRRVPVDDHLVCFNSVRAAALLALGQSRQARRELQTCISLGKLHNQRSMAHVRLLSAVAHAGYDNRRTEQLLRAFSRGGSLQSSLFLSLLPSNLTDSLRNFENFPGLSGFRPNQADDSLHLFGNLSLRELGLLGHLNSESSLEEIARVAHLSRNTVASQARSVYAKLGVNRRVEAADLAATYGLSAETSRRIGYGSTPAETPKRVVADKRAGRVHLGPDAAKRTS